jgi:hypothetical protein
VVDLDAAPGGFAVIGAGKTAMDTCNWLLAEGVDADRIQWIRPREPWMIDRKSFQPLDQVASYMQMQAAWVEASVDAAGGLDLARRLEAAGYFLRIDSNVEPEVYRGPIISAGELNALRTIDRVVRKGKVLGIRIGSIELEGGSVGTRPDTVLVDCTAAGVRPTTVRPIFAGSRITLQHVTITGVCLSVATLGVIEATRTDDAEKNRLAPPLTFTGNASDLLGFTYAGMAGLYARTSESDLAAWAEGCRLNPAAGALQHIDEPEVAAAFTSMMSNFGPAMRNLRGHGAGRELAAPA